MSDTNKFKIEIHKQETDTLPRIRLSLEQDTDGVDLVAVDANGDTERYILKVRDDGTVLLYEGGRLDAGHRCDERIPVKEE